MSFCYLQRWLAVEAVKSGDLASERLKPIDAPPGYTFKTSGSSGLRNLLQSRSNTTSFAWSEPLDVPVSKELMEPPDLYSSGEFKDNEAHFMTREGPLSIQRIECLQYTEERVPLLFLYTKERVSYLHGEESVLRLFVEVAGR